MNSKACFAVVFAALLIGAGIAALGYFHSQQGVEFLKAQENAFIRQMQQAVKPLDKKG